MNIFLLLIIVGQSGYAGSPADCVYSALSSTNINASSVVFDIGSGDGRVVAIASKIYKCKSVGIEYDKNLAELSKKTVQRNNLTTLVTIKNEDALTSDFSTATIIYLYHQSGFLNKLKPQLDKLKVGTTIICLDYPLPWRNDKPTKTMLSTDGHNHSVYIYVVTKSESPLIDAAKIYSGVRFQEGIRDAWLVQVAQKYSEQMAAINSQSYRGEGHFGVEKRYADIRQKYGMKGNEVTAESWYWKTNYPIDIIAKEMYDSWHYSSGHWSVVSKPHKMYGDGLAKSRQGIWYATIIVAD
jgi:hypothetical protein